MRHGWKSVILSVLVGGCLWMTGCRPRLPVVPSAPDPDRKILMMHYMPWYMAPTVP